MAVIRATNKHINLLAGVA